jgi:uncharacterized Zn-binding protein involved in type VI secretion
VIGPGAPTVLIGGLPAAVMGDNCVCVGPPDSIIKGSATVMIGGKPAARLGDTTAHGGSIVLGMPNVMITRQHHFWVRAGHFPPDSPLTIVMLSWSRERKIYARVYSFCFLQLPGSD